MQRKNGTLLELDLLDLMRSKHYAELYERVIKELENLDQSKVASKTNDLSNSFLHMADEINYLYHKELRMIGILEAICIVCMFLVGVLFPLGILIYMTVMYIKGRY